MQRGNRRIFVKNFIKYERGIRRVNTDDDINFILELESIMKSEYDNDMQKYKR